MWEAAALYVGHILICGAEVTVNKVSFDSWYHTRLVGMDGDAPRSASQQSYRWTSYGCGKYGPPGPSRLIRISIRTISLSMQSASKMR
jgi:hypothetical protein